MVLQVSALLAQRSDSARTIVVTPKVDSASIDSIKKKHKPMSLPDKAALMSAIIPGLGQIGHHDTWWHVPIIYAGFGVFGYFIYDNNNQYLLYKGYYTMRLNAIAKAGNPHDPYWDLLSDQGLLDDRDYYRRNRDLLIFITAGWYAANIIDAYVAAHLRDFDISNNLSMRLEPLNFTNIGTQSYVTSGVKFNLK